MAEAAWMVRSDGGALFERFKKGAVAVGWSDIGDLGAVRTREEIRTLFERTYPDDPPGRATNAISVLYKIRSAIGVGDSVVTYDPDSRQYLVGRVIDEYRFAPTVVDTGHPHTRSVSWHGSVLRDSLSAPTRNTLGSTLALFSINEDATAELLAVLKGEVVAPQTVNAAKEDLAAVKEDEAAKALELVKDAIVALSEREMEHLAASVLRAMGYHARVTPIGPDRGIDVIASPDGLGLEEPRIKVEVKHRAKTAMGAQDVRTFLSILRPGDRGLYISTGGFSKEARYEAERATHPTTLIDLGELAGLVIQNYESFDVEGRVLLPLVKVYLPVE